MKYVYIVRDEQSIQRCFTSPAKAAAYVAQILVDPSQAAQLAYHITNAVKAYDYWESADNFSIRRFELE